MLTFFILPAVRLLFQRSDTAVRLQAFAATSMADNPAVKDYHGERLKRWASLWFGLSIEPHSHTTLLGLFRVQKLPRLNGISTVVPETLDLAFKLRRTGLRVEVLCLNNLNFKFFSYIPLHSQKLHLPPDLGDTVSRGDDTATSAGV